MYGISVLISPLNMSRPEVISLHCECFIYEKLIHKHPRNTKTAPVQIRKKKKKIGKKLTTSCVDRKGQKDT